MLTTEIRSGNKLVGVVRALTLSISGITTLGPRDEKVVIVGAGLKPRTVVPPEILATGNLETTIDLLNTEYSQGKNVIAARNGFPNK